MKIAKKLCDICLQSFVPWHLKQVHNHFFCAGCLKLLADGKSVRLETSDSPAPDNPVSGVKANILKVVNDEGEELVREAKASGRTITVGFLTAVLSRI
jgi:hypothetical protein